MAARLTIPAVCRTLAAALLLGGAAVHAQAAEAGDPPERVARLSYLTGDAGLLPAGAHDWGDAELNRPLTRGDRLATTDEARAELDFGGATLRMDRDSDVGLLELDRQLAQIELTGGSLAVHVRTLAEGQTYEIDTPTVALVIDRPTDVRVDVGRDGKDTTVSVFDGQATVYGEDDARREVVADRRYRFVNATLDTVAIEELQGGDDFDAWCDGRERRYADASSGRYVDEELVGASDLDRYGTWREDTVYGSVWYPSQVQAGWAPYRDGRWTWIDPWGWTWVDTAPWGFAPYHYGRWAWVHGAWGWLPGPLGIRPIYAPALVAFVGGASWHVGVGAPIGWVPLAPGEIYHPWYHNSRDYYRRVNMANLRHDRTRVEQRLDHEYFEHHRSVPVRAERYRNMRGVTAMPLRAFEGAERVRGHRLHVDPARLARAPVIGRPAAERPRRLVAPRRADARRLPVHAFERTVVARHVPTPVAGSSRLVRREKARSAMAPPVRVLDRRHVPARDHGRADIATVDRPSPVRARPAAPARRADSDRRAATAPRALRSAGYVRHRPAGPSVARRPIVREARSAPGVSPARLPRVTRLRTSRSDSPSNGSIPTRVMSPRALPQVPRFRHEAEAGVRHAASIHERPAPMLRREPVAVPRAIPRAAVERPAPRPAARTAPARAARDAAAHPGRRRATIPSKRSAEH